MTCTGLVEMDLQTGGSRCGTAVVRDAVVLNQRRRRIADDHTSALVVVNVGGRKLAVRAAAELDARELGARNLDIAQAHTAAADRELPPRNGCFAPARMLQP